MLEGISAGGDPFSSPTENKIILVKRPYILFIFKHSTLQSIRRGSENIYVNVKLPIMAPPENNIPHGKTFTIIVTTSRKSLMSILPRTSPPAGGDAFL